MNRIKRILFAAGAVLFALPLAAQVSFTGTYSQNFDSMGTTGTAPPSGWSQFPCNFGTNATWSTSIPASGTNSVASMAVSTAGTTLTVNNAPTATNNNGYNAQGASSSDRVLATSPTSYAGAIIQLRLTNNTGSPLNSINVGYDIRRYTVATTANELPGYWLFYSLDNGTTWTNISALTPVISGSTGVVVPNTVGVTTVPPTTITFGSSVANGSGFVLRWVDDNAQQTSPDQIIGLDNVSISVPGSAPPTLTAAAGATVDSPFTVTFTDSSAWRSAITGVTVGGTTLTAGYAVSAGQITFTPSASLPASLLQTSGSLSIAVKATGYTDASVTQTLGSGAAAKLAIKTQPTAPAMNGGTLATQPVVTIQDQYGNTTTSTAAVTAATGAGAWTLGGTTSVNAVSGSATFSGLTATSGAAVSGATIGFSATGLTGVTSSPFNLTAPAPTLTAAATATVDAPFTVTFTDDSTWRSGITSITVGGTTLSASAYAISAGQITFTPAQSTLLQTSGTKSIAVNATGYGSDSVSQPLGAGGPTQLAITTQPTAPPSDGGVLAAQPAVAIRDQYGNTTTSTSAVTAAVGAGTWTLGGTASVNAVAGTATFSGLTATSTAAVTGATISFSSAGLTSVTSSAFNIPAPTWALFTGAYTQNFDSLGTTGTSLAVIPEWTVYALSGTHDLFTWAASGAVTTDFLPWSTPTAINVGSGSSTLASSSTLTVNTFASATDAGVKTTYGYNFGASYAPNVATDRALGSSPTGSAGTELQLTLKNASGSAINSLQLGYDIRRFTTTAMNNSYPNSPWGAIEELPGYSVFYSLDGGNTWTNVGGLTPADLLYSTPPYPSGGPSVPNTVGVTHVASTPITLASAWNNGATLLIRWFDDNAEGPSPDQNIGLDNVVITNASTAPALTAAANATVDAPFAVTFTDDPTWRAAVTGITVNGTTLTSGYTLGAGTLTFTPASSVPVALLQTSGSLSIAVSATGYNATTVTQTLGAGVPAVLSITTQPVAPAANGAVMATQPVLTTLDQYHNATTGTVTVTASASDSSWTIGGTTAVDAVAGVATFSNLSASSLDEVPGATIAFSAPGLSGVTSNPFDIPGPPAPTLTAAAAATVDAPFTVTFTDNPAWRSFITGITVGGTTLAPSAYSTNAGQITFTPAQSPLLQSSGTLAIAVTATGFANATVSQPLAAGAPAQLAIATQPTAPAVNGGALGVQPAVALMDQYGNPTVGTVTVTAAPGQVGWSLGGTATAVATAGTATFGGLTASSATVVTGATIAFSAPGLSGVTSTPFNIPGPPAPALVAAAGATVDAPFTVTFTDNAVWRSAITGITVGGTTLSPTAYAVSSGRIVFTPAQSPLLESSGTLAVAVAATGFANATVSQPLAAGAGVRLFVTTQPAAPANSGGLLGMQPVVAIRDQYGNTTTSTATVTAAVASGSWTLGGTTSVAAVAGTATFANLTATNTAAVTGATIRFSASGLTSVTSSPFDLADPNSAVWSFGIISDTQWTVTDDGKNPNTTSADIISQVNQEFITKGVKFVVAIGDLCDNGSTAGEDARAAYAQSLYNAGIAFFPLRGNHDGITTEFLRIYPQTGGGMQNNTPSDVFAAGNDTLLSPPAKTGSAFGFGQNYSTPSAATGYSYSFDYNNARIILLDQFISTIDSQQSWITTQLTGKGAGNHGFVFGHKGLITENHVDNLFGSSPSADPTETDAFISSLATNKVHYYVGGHDHMHDYTVVATTDGVTAHVSELVCASDSSKFYTPASPSNDQTYDVPAFGHTRQTPVAQDLFEIGYYLVTVDGPRVTVNYYAVPSGSSGADISTTPPLTGHWVLKHTFGYSLNGQEFMVPQGQPYTTVQDNIAAGAGFNGTSMRILNGSNGSTKKDGSNRPWVKQIDTGWSPVSGSLASDVLTLWGMKDLAAANTDTYAVSVSYNPALVQTAATGGQFYLASKNAGGNWVKAVDLNVGGASQFVAGPYTAGMALGTYGVDTNTMTVWAVVNHDGTFAAFGPANTPPVVTVPNTITVEATSAAGSTVSFTVTATDAEDGALTPVVTPASGSTFPVGTTTVNASATDSAGATTTNSFQIIVRDTTAPVITVPSTITAEATGQSGAAVSFTVSATDLVSGAVAPTVVPASGSVFPLGTTTVTATATDGVGNIATNAFQVVVQHTVAPVAGAGSLHTIRNQQATLAVADLLAVCGEPNAYTLSISGVSAASTQAGSVQLAANTITYTPPFGATGTDTFTYTVSDGAGLTAQGTVTVTIAAHGPASQIVFTTQPPASTVAGTPFAAAPVVAVEDAIGNVVTDGDDSTVAIGLALTNGTGTLSGTTTVIAAQGLASFDGLSIDKTGTDKVLTASATLAAGPVTAQTNPAFAVLPGGIDHFAISSIASPQAVGRAISGIVVTAKDALNNTVDTFAGTANVTGAGVNITTGNFSAGVLSALSVTPATAGQAQTLTLTDSASAATGTSNPFEVKPLLDFAFGTDSAASGTPVTWAGGVVKPGQPTVLVGGDGFYATFARRADWSTTAGITYTVEFSADLAYWAASDATPSGIQQGDNGFDVVRVRFPDTIRTPDGLRKPLFFRLNIGAP